jgi:ribosomal protein L27
MRADDDTLYAGKNGVVKFASKTKTKFDGNRRSATLVSVE